MFTKSLQLQDSDSVSSFSSQKRTFLGFVLFRFVVLKIWFEVLASVSCFFVLALESLFIGCNFISELGLLLMLVSSILLLLFVSVPVVIRVHGSCSSASGSFLLRSSIKVLLVQDSIMPPKRQRRGAPAPIAHTVAGVPNVTPQDVPP